LKADCDFENNWAGHGLKTVTRSDSDRIFTVTNGLKIRHRAGFRLLRALGGKIYNDSFCLLGFKP
jgi:hypothetical protein